MKHFDKLDFVAATLYFPEDWGDAFRHVMLNGEDCLFNDAIWEIWSELVKKTKAKAWHINDKCCGFDVGSVAFEVAGFRSPKELDEAISWCEKQMHKAYKTVCKG